VAPLTIGLTGGIAAGKSEALAAFGRLGAATLSSDAVVHDLLEGEPLRAEMVERWGPEVAPAGAPTDRGRIGGIVFADPEQLTWLESKLHPAVGAATAAFVAGLPEDTEFAVVEVPLLFEGGREKVFDTTVSIVAAEDVRRAPPPAATPWSTPARRAS
jgi:dephospho-CoA kinase